MNAEANIESYIALSELLGDWIDFLLTNPTDIADFKETKTNWEETATLEFKHNGKYNSVKVNLGLLSDPIQEYNDVATMHVTASEDGSTTQLTYPELNKDKAYELFVAKTIEALNPTIKNYGEKLMQVLKYWINQTIAFSSLLDDNDSSGEDDDMEEDDLDAFIKLPFEWFLGFVNKNFNQKYSKALEYVLNKKLSEVIHDSLLDPQYVELCVDRIHFLTPEDILPTSKELFNRFIETHSWILTDEAIKEIYSDTVHKVEDVQNVVEKINLTWTNDPKKQRAHNTYLCFFNALKHGINMLELEQQSASTVYNFNDKVLSQTWELIADLPYDKDLLLAVSFYCRVLAHEGNFSRLQKKIDQSKSTRDDGASIVYTEILEKSPAHRDCLNRMMAAQCSEEEFHFAYRKIVKTLDDDLRNSLIRLSNRMEADVINDVKPLLFDFLARWKDKTENAEIFVVQNIKLDIAEMNAHVPILGNGMFLTDDASDPFYRRQFLGICSDSSFTPQKETRIEQFYSLFDENDLFENATIAVAQCTKLVCQKNHWSVDETRPFVPCDDEITLLNRQHKLFQSNLLYSNELNANSFITKLTRYLKGGDFPEMGTTARLSLLPLLKMKPALSRNSNELNVDPTKDILDALDSTDDEEFPPFITGSSSAEEHFPITSMPQKNAQMATEELPKIDNGSDSFLTRLGGNANPNPGNASPKKRSRSQISNYAAETQENVNDATRSPALHATEESLGQSTPETQAKRQKQINYITISDSDSENGSERDVYVVAQAFSDLCNIRD